MQICKIKIRIMLLPEFTKSLVPFPNINFLTPTSATHSYIAKQKHADCFKETVLHYRNYNKKYTASKQLYGLCKHILNYTLVKSFMFMSMSILIIWDLLVSTTNFVPVPKIILFTPPVTQCKNTKQKLSVLSGSSLKNE